MQIAWSSVCFVVDCVVKLYLLIVLDNLHIGCCLLLYLWFLVMVVYCCL